MVYAFAKACFIKSQKLILDLESLQKTELSVRTESFYYEVIIPTTGRAIYLKDVLNDLAAQTMVPKNVIIVEQNARRCLQIVDRGYVLDQGKNAYTGTGASLANDPKVIELYLGTLAKA